MATKITKEYVTEKLEAYDVAIGALMQHEPGSDCDKKLAFKLRTQLVKKLDNEIQTWYNKYGGIFEDGTKT